MGIAKLCDFIHLKLTLYEREKIYTSKWCIEEYIIYAVLNIINAKYANILLFKNLDGKNIQPLTNRYKCVKKKY